MDPGTAEGQAPPSAFITPMPRAAPPPNRIVQGTRQNTLQLNPGDVVRVDPPDPSGGPNRWVWAVVNWGPAPLWVRWDGFGTAAVNDPNSVQLPAQAAYDNLQSNRSMTLATGAATLVSLTIENPIG